MRESVLEHRNKREEGKQIEKQGRALCSERNSPSHTHTFMMWEESEKPEEGGGARLVGEAGGLGLIWAAMQ